MESQSPRDYVIIGHGWMRAEALKPLIHPARRRGTWAPTHAVEQWDAAQPATVAITPGDPPGLIDGSRRVAALWELDRKRELVPVRFVMRARHASYPAGLASGQRLV